MTPTVGTGVTVTIRMYRQGLGDCFLLHFAPKAGAAGAEVWVLIDCGVLADEDGTRIRAVAEDIRATTQRLDIVVVTHAHWDHISGFAHARDVFESMEIGEVWLPSTEDPGNGPACALKARRLRELSTLRGLLQSERVRNSPLMIPSVASVMRLFGECTPREGEREGTIPSAEFESALAFLNDATKRTVRYLDSRDQPAPLAGLLGVRVYALGPQRHEPVRGGTLNPDGGSNDERATLDLGVAFLAAAQAQLVGMDEADQLLYKDVLEQLMPFEPHYRCPVEPTLLELGAAPGPSWSASLSPKARARTTKSYLGSGNAWRSIDDDWLGITRTLTLALDQDINNSSLALAFELGDNGKVLLFPGDAQLSSWNTWNLLEWEVPPEPGAAGSPRKISAVDLIRRTQVYKVAHNCSAGATPLAKGLDMMQRADLVALLPVSATAAASFDWNLPHQPLLARLYERARGRVLRSDQTVQWLDARGEAGDSVWQNFRAHVRDDNPLYYEYTAG